MINGWAGLKSLAYLFLSRTQQVASFSTFAKLPRQLFVSTNYIFYHELV